MQIDKTWLTAGKAIFTVEPPADFVAANGVKPHYTYKIRRKAASGTFRFDAYFLYLLTGPDNQNDYTYLGKVGWNKGEVFLSDKSAMPGESWPVKIARKTLVRLWQGEQATIEATGWKVHHEGRCGRCAAPLTVPASVESGYGPECIKYVA
jgi:hypothetical protein